jgi:hypothetical protein
MKILTELLDKFPLLNQINFDIFNPPLANPKCIIANRHDKFSIAIYVPSQNIPQLLSTFNVSVPDSLTEILNQSSAIMIDLESTQTDQLRFYLYDQDYNKDYFQNLYKFDSTVDQYDTDNHIKPIGLGFFMDKVTGEIAQYKYYWYDPVCREAHLFRFGTSGEFINHSKETGSFSPNIGDLDVFLPVLAGVESLPYHGLSHVTREDGTHSYVTINEYDGYPGNYQDISISPVSSK